MAGGKGTKGTFAPILCEVDEIVQKKPCTVKTEARRCH